MNHLNPSLSSSARYFNNKEELPLSKPLNYSLPLAQQPYEKLQTYFVTKHKIRTVEQRLPLEPIRKRLL